jgi:hypothetical protein
MDGSRSAMGAGEGGGEGKMWNWWHTYHQRTRGVGEGGDEELRPTYLRKTGGAGEGEMRNWRPTYRRKTGGRWRQREEEDSGEGLQF